MLANQIPTLDFGLGDEVDMLRDSVRSFAAERIAPIAAEIDRTDEFPRSPSPGSPRSPAAARKNRSGAPCRS